MRDPLFKSLGDLVTYFSKTPINGKSGLLEHPCRHTDRADLQELFDELDDNQSYQLDFREFKRWLNGSDAEFEKQLHDPEYA